MFFLYSKQNPAEWCTWTDESRLGWANAEPRRGRKEFQRVLAVHSSLLAPWPHLK